VKKTCEKIFHLIPASVAGETGDADQAAVEAHVNSCERCMRFAAYYRALIGEGRKLEAAPDFEAVWSSVAEATNAPRQLPTGIQRKSFKWLILLPAAAAVAVLVVLLPTAKPREVRHPLSVSEMEKILRDLDAPQARVEDTTDHPGDGALSGLDTSGNSNSLKLAGVSDADSRYYEIDMF
jgi:anti-sigma factor RsiW